MFNSPTYVVVLEPKTGFKEKRVRHNMITIVKSANTYSLIERELSPYNIQIIRKYDSELVKQSLAKATRLKHLQIILNLTRFTNKDWKDITKEDIGKLVLKIVGLWK